MQRCSLTISEMQVQTTVRPLSAPLGMAIFKIREKDLSEDVEERGPLCVGRGNATWCSPYGEQQEVPQNSKLELPYDQHAIPGVVSKRMSVLCPAELYLHSLATQREAQQPGYRSGSCPSTDGRTLATSRAA